jgi:hypothetical protein
MPFIFDWWYADHCFSSSQSNEGHLSRRQQTSAATFNRQKRKIRREIPMATTSLFQNCKLKNSFVDKAYITFCQSESDE